MWIPQIENWNTSHTKLSKYFLERIKQKVDPKEIISNKHRTSNGYTLIEEIILVAENSLLRDKSFKRLESLFEESTNLSLPFSIPNDFILKKYFPDIIEYYLMITKNQIKNEQSFIRSIITTSKIHSIRLQKYYYQKIVQEINSIDFHSTQFDRFANIIDEIIECLLPYLFFKGYSTTGIDKTAYWLVTKNDGVNCAKKMIANHNLLKKEYNFLIKDDTSDGELNGITEYLDRKGIKYQKNSFEDLNTGGLKSDTPFSTGDKFLVLSHDTIDPHAFIRNLYDKGLKDYVRKKDRSNLQYFTDFVDKVYWKFSSKPDSTYKATRFDLDPISVPDRGSTLRHTLSKYSTEKTYDNFTLPYIKQLLQPTYFYNLAIGSKSIENSLFLLWTSLETLLPYRMHKNDISNVQHFVSNSLGFGSIVRELSSFIMRMIETNRINSGSLNIIKYEGADLFNQRYFEPKKETYLKWANWLCEDHDKLNPQPFSLIEANSNLLCRQYCKLHFAYRGINGNKNTIKHWNNKIEASELAIKYQLDRIYLHRNQIVHSGKFVNEYSNLWSHLEWYTGKLLAYAYLRFHRNPEYDNEQIFMELESDGKHIKNLIKNNSNKSIYECKDLFPIIFRHTWQSF